MSGHSKWATTKHKKAIVDAKRGKMFAKLIKNIEVAARMGGADIEGNPTLYDAIQKAKKSSVPNDNIDRAVKRGSGVGERTRVDYITIMYEGYAPGGVALLIECLTDNKNRAAMEVRTAMTRNGGSLADPGSVSLHVQPQGRRHRPGRAGGRQTNEDDVLEAVLEAGAEEVNDLDGTFEVISEADRPGRRAHRAAGCRHRLRLGRRVLRADRDGRGRRRRRPQDLPADRRARGQRRRAERLRQLRRVRRGHGPGPGPDLGLGASLPRPTHQPSTLSNMRSIASRADEGAGDRSRADPMRRRCRRRHRRPSADHGARRGLPHAARPRHRATPAPARAADRGAASSRTVPTSWPSSGSSASTTSAP